MGIGLGSDEVCCVDKRSYYPMAKLVESEGDEKHYLLQDPNYCQTEPTWQQNAFDEISIKLLV